MRARRAPRTARDFMRSDRDAKPPWNDSVPAIGDLGPVTPLAPEVLHHVGMLAADYALDQDDPETVLAELAAVLGLTAADPPPGCVHCGQRVLRVKNRPNRKYCDPSCRSKHTGAVRSQQKEIRDADDT